jgi:predicted TPR repeat methyltransferase
MADEKSSVSGSDRLAAWWHAIKDAASSRRSIAAHDAELRELRRALGTLERAADSSAAEYSSRLDLVRHDLGQLTPRVDALDAAAKRLPAMQEQLSALQNQLSALQNQLGASQAEFMAQQMKLAAEVARLAPRVPALAGAGEGDSATWLDAAFEETFRGTREQVRQRLAVYLPDVRDVIAAVGQRQVVDVGCGRGEWLELMRTEGITARGVDQNSFIVNQCREVGLDAQCADAIKVLADEPAGSLAAVTAFHVIEHLRLAEQLQLMVAAYHALAPAGLFILETPNPENLVVGAWTFYMDPSHQRPLPPTLLRFLLEAVGFEVVDVRRLHVDDGRAERAAKEGWPSGVRELLCGPRDFGVIARRPPV